MIEAPWEVADVLVVGGQKWLRAGWGTGFAVLSDRALERMDPVLSGWTGARDPGLFDDEIHPPDATAQAWSISNLSPITSGAFAEALELVEDAGVGAIAARIAERIASFEEVLASCGAEVVSATERRAGILAFTLPGHPAEQVGAALANAGIAATVRPEHVRLSPHASTPAAAADLLRSALETLTAPREPLVVPAAGATTHEVLTALVPAIPGLAAMLGPGNEVLLHDLARLPDSIVAIAGDLTGRSVGGPMTDLLLGLVRRGTTQDLTNYRTHGPDGRAIRSSTLFLRDADGVAVGCLCVNSIDASASGGRQRGAGDFPTGRRQPATVPGRPRGDQGRDPGGPDEEAAQGRGGAGARRSRLFPHQGRGRPPGRAARRHPLHDLQLPQRSPRLTLPVRTLFRGPSGADHVPMTEPDTQRALVRLEVEDEAGDEELDRLARRLRAELGELDVDVLAVAGDLPAGAKAADPVTIGSLVVAFSAAGGVFPGLLETLREWLGRQAGKHRIKVTVDGDTVELERATSAERQQLIDAFVRRHG